MGRGWGEGPERTTRPINIGGMSGLHEGTHPAQTSWYEIDVLSSYARPWSQGPCKASSLCPKRVWGFGECGAELLSSCAGFRRRMPETNFSVLELCRDSAEVRVPISAFPNQTAASPQSPREGGEGFSGLRASLAGFRRRVPEPNFSVLELCRDSAEVRAPISAFPNRSAASRQSPREGGEGFSGLRASLAGFRQSMPEANSQFWSSVKIPRRPARRSLPSRINRRLPPNRSGKAANAFRDSGDPPLLSASRPLTSGGGSRRLILPD